MAFGSIACKEMWCKQPWRAHAQQQRWVTPAGVLLYVIMAGNLPFDESNLPTLFKKISRADYPTPPWFTPDMTSLFKAMLNPSVKKRYAVSLYACMHVNQQLSMLGGFPQSICRPILFYLICATWFVPGSMCWYCMNIVLTSATHSWRSWMRCCICSGGHLLENSLIMQINPMHANMQGYYCWDSAT